MAKSSRASTNKANNRRLKSKVFGPVEDARMQRLSAKLLELAAQPAPEQPQESSMDVANDEGPTDSVNSVANDKETEDMEVDQSASKSGIKSKTQMKKKIEKRKAAKSKSTMVFARYKSKTKGKK